MKLFETTLSFTEKGETGKEKKVSRILLIDTLTYGHAEEIGMKWFEENKTEGARKIAGIKESNIDEINTEETESDFYLARVTFSDGEKVDNMNVLVDGEDLKDAGINLEESMREFLSDTEVLKIEKSKIIEIIYPNREVKDELPSDSLDFGEDKE